ncbi:glycosyltransferase family 4 protein [Candidatus Sumerlaeota bacterium]|nr:glycosyltransferase family 4 protein [Candidatus Sumerlaeota bacterium]
MMQLPEEIRPRKPVVFVMPWYGERITGGAEALCRDYCHALRSAGVDARVAATCCHDAQSDWNRNQHAPGERTESGVPVRRFPVCKRDWLVFDQINRNLLNRYPISPSDERRFFEESIRSEALEEWLRESAAELHAIFLPYCFGSTYFGVRAAGEHGTLLPCLHQESYAWMQPVREMFERAPRLIFNSEPERRFANQLFKLGHKPQIVLGCGVELERRGEAERFRKKFGVERPYLLYLGRKDATKNVPLLTQFFERLLEAAPLELDLLLAGPDRAPLARGGSSRVRDLGMLTDQDKLDALEGCLALAQPSLHESLGIVLLEAWRAGRPVIVNDYCDVTRELCSQAGGGLYFRDFFEFREVVERLAGQPDEAAQLGAQGRQWVERECRWEVLVRRLCEFL